jgi:hypothetical protein
MSEGSFIFNLWLKPPVPVYLKVYIFNVTNAEEFLKGGVKLKLDQVGPYVYRCFYILLLCVFLVSHAQTNLFAIVDVKHAKEDFYPKSC